ncbi:S-layer homology domain-containing protein [Lentibacillus sp. Marseille-P4043]|uniref:S-layer homology domain-containing protein n=1 Tax=Lentibacillus sp. Marseille-P4043 TaxID=2040293 RepID=UPI000D0AF8CF|nr:S-layer homology domain-containing protein [Lentibacillus sp. Marseille-P4043]
MSNKNTYRKFATTSLAATAAAVAVVPAVSAAEFNGYTDVNPGDSHYDGIKALTEQGVIKGYEDGSFGVYDNVTRQQVAVMLSKAMNLDTPSDVAGALNVYSDVDENSLYAEEIAAVTEANVFKGSNGEFNPDEDITREQMATVLVLAFGLDQYDVSDVDVNLDGVGDSHADRVQVLANLEITNQVEDFRPEEGITRGAFSTMLHLSQEYVKNHEVDADIEVESVSAINTSTFVVTAENAEEAKKASNSSVDVTLDGEAWEVVSVTDNENGTYNVEVADLDGKKGTISINGKEFEVDYSESALTSAISDVNNAEENNVIEKLEAPILNLTDIDEDSAVKYVEEIGSSFTTTRVQIQAAVDRVNEEVAKAQAEQVAAVNDAKGELELFKALNDLGIDRVIGLNDAEDGVESVSLGLDYYDAISNQTTETKTQIQEVVDAVNSAKVTDLVEKAEADLTDDAVENASGLLSKYDSGNDKDTVEKDFQTRLDVVSALVDVNDAENETNLLNSVKAEILEVENIDDDNKTAYINEIDELIKQNKDFEFTSVSQLQAFIDDVNAEEAQSLIDAVNDAETPEALKIALSNLESPEGFDQESAQKLFLEVNGEKTYKNVKDIKADFTESYLVSKLNDAKKENINDAVTAFVNEYGNDAYVNTPTTNRSEVVETFWVNNGSERNTFTTAQEVSSALTEAVEEYNGYLESINNVTSTTQMRTALNLFVDDLEAAYGEELTSKVDMLNDSSVYANGDVTVSAATEIYEALVSKRADENKTNNDFATIVEAWEVLDSSNTDEK